MITLFAITNVQAAHTSVIMVIAIFFFLFWISERNTSEKLKNDLIPILLGSAAIFWIVPFIFLSILGELGIETRDETGDRPIRIQNGLYAISLINSALFVAAYQYFDNAPSRLKIFNLSFLTINPTDRKIWAGIVPLTAGVFTLWWQNYPYLYDIPNFLYGTFTLFLLWIGITESFKYKEKPRFATIGKVLLILLFLYQFTAFIPKSILEGKDITNPSTLGTLLQIVSLTISVSLLILLFLLTFYSVQDEALKLNPKKLKLSLSGQLPDHKKFVVAWDIDDTHIESIHSWAPFKGLLRLAIEAKKSKENNA